MKTKTMDKATLQVYIDKIFSMTQLEMATAWRRAPSGDPMFDCQYPLFEIFQKRFKELGGFNPEISKQVGWKEGWRSWDTFNLEDALAK